MRDRGVVVVDHVVVDTLDSLLATDPLDIVVPTSPLPENLVDQRQWAEVRKLQVDTERAAAELDAYRRREADVAAEEGRRTYTFYARVEEESVRACMATLSSWSSKAPAAPLTIVFNSPGGAVHDGLALFDFLRHLRTGGHHLTTIALGRAASMGAVLLQAGDRRVIGGNAFLMLHEVSNGMGGKVSELEESVELSKRLQKRLLAILAERSTLAVAQIQRRWTRRDWWLDAEETVAYGFADALM
jgi:ATP-dependent Clp endopeptidase proteolytic subunit ClpP